MTTCDICGKETGPTELQDLRKYYQTNSIKQICDECRLEVNNHLDKLQQMSFKMNEHWLKKFMKNLRIKKTC